MYSLLLLDCDTQFVELDVLVVVQVGALRVVPCETANSNLHLSCSWPYYSPIISGYKSAFSGGKAVEGAICLPFLEESEESSCLWNKVSEMSIFHPWTPSFGQKYAQQPCGHSLAKSSSTVPYPFRFWQPWNRYAQSTSCQQTHSWQYVMRSKTGEKQRGQELNRWCNQKG